MSKNILFWLAFFILGVLFGFLISSRESRFFRDELSLCNQDLAACQEMLDDPHHCVSVVVEALEGDGYVQQ